MKLTRREAVQTIALTSAAILGGPLARASEIPAPAFTLPKLAYAFDALEPHIDAQTMQIHYTKHHAAYVDNLNKAITKYPDLWKQSIDDLVRNLDKAPEDIRTIVRNHGGGHANHSLFWDILSKDGGGEPGGPLGDAIKATFGDYATAKSQLVAAAKGVFGSGWAWLSLDTQQQLVVETTPNQDSPLTAGHTPLLGIDVWEHAYYLKYQNRRADYLDAIFNVLDWEVIGAKYIERVSA